MVDLGIHLYGFLGPGWILDRKEILGEPVKWLNSTEMVVDLGKVDLGKSDLGDIVEYF